MKTIRLLLVLLLMAAMSSACATVLASLDHDHIGLGDSVTLSITSDASAAQPDLSPLRSDFEVRGTATSSQTNIVNGSAQSSVQWSVELLPRHSGTITVAALKVGADLTQPLRLDVSDHPSASAPAPSDANAANGTPVFIETTIDTPRPYVQQAVLYTVRLYYALTPLPGASLDVPPPDNGDMRQLDNDITSSTTVHGRRYNVLERHYLLQPDHSGALRLPAPSFHGRTMGDIEGMLNDDMFGGNGGDVRVAGKPIDVQVRARSQQAGDPWLPARSLTLDIEPPTAPLHAGEPFGVMVKLEGDGVTAAQLPDIALPVIAGAQVYPEPSTTAERWRDGHLLAERTRRFAIVPEYSGRLQLPDLTMSWWDVANDHAALARAALPALQVLPGAASQDDAGTHSASNARVGMAAAPAATGMTALRAWQIASVGLVVALLLTFWWGWRRGPREVAPQTEHGVLAEPVANCAPSLKRALALGDPSVIAQALLESAPGTPPRHLGDLAQRLDDDAQRSALQAFDAARWSRGGQPSEQALARLREAFGHPPRWRTQARHTCGQKTLPPLYPT